MFEFLTATLHAVLIAFGFGQLNTPAAGTIEGRVVVRQLPARVAARYPGTGSSTREVESPPAIVFIEGVVPGSTPPVPRDPQMAQQDTAFQPSTLIIPLGTSVRFPNQDKFFHNVFSYSKTKRFDLGRYPKGEAKSVVFDKPGTVAVFCEIHKWMRGAIAVVENGLYADVKADGTFRIANVPAGTYKLSVWHSERGKKTFDVVVPANGTVRVDANL